MAFLILACALYAYSLYNTVVLAVHHSSNKTSDTCKAMPQLVFIMLTCILLIATSSIIMLTDLSEYRALLLFEAVNLFNATSHALTTKRLIQCRKSPIIYST